MDFWFLSCICDLSRSFFYRLHASRMTLLILVFAFDVGTVLSICLCKTFEDSFFPVFLLMCCSPPFNISFSGCICRLLMTINWWMFVFFSDFTLGPNLRSPNPYFLLSFFDLSLSFGHFFHRFLQQNEIVRNGQNKYVIYFHLNVCMFS